MASKKAIKFVKEKGSLAPPKHILNAPTPLMKELDYGKDYQYDHDTPESFSGQNYFPQNLERSTFYEPKGHGKEEEILNKLKTWQNLRQQFNQKITK